MRACLLVPHYDHLRQFSSLLPRLLATGLPLIVVDDGSPEEVYRSLESLLQGSDAKSDLVRHRENLGKGGAVMTGLRTAAKLGHTHAVQVDADGQHDVRGLAGLLDEAERHPSSLVCGAPQFDESISGFRRKARAITNLLCRLEALDSTVVDAMCGFRCYPLAEILPLIDRTKFPERMGFDPEILVRSCWAGVELRFVPVNVRYPDEGRSHFRYFGDNLEISWMHTRLLVGMLIRLPGVALRRTRARSSS